MSQIRIRKSPLGISQAKGTFKVIETQKHLDFSIFQSMINPDIYEIPVYVIRNFYSKEICMRLQKRFQEIILKTDGGNRKGFVPVNQIGATQFLKNSQEYMEECISTRGNVNHLVDALGDALLIEDFLLGRTFREKFKEIGFTFRPASYNNQMVNVGTIRKWINNKDGLALLPHEDLSQLNVAKVDNFEIHEIRKVIACNICISNDQGGELIVWNIAPSLEQRKEFGVENNGYPYPLEWVEQFEQIAIKIHPGDLYFINANFIHGVKKVNAGSRITMGRFIGIKSKKEIVYWT